MTKRMELICRSSLSNVDGRILWQWILRDGQAIGNVIGIAATPFLVIRPNSGYPNAGATMIASPIQLGASALNRKLSQFCGTPNHRKSRFCSTNSAAATQAAQFSNVKCIP